MANKSIQYKVVIPEWVVNFQIYTPGGAEGRVIGRGKRRARPRAGIVVDTQVPFPVGTMVVVDLVFPNQEYTYRANGLVSWVVEPEDEDKNYKTGVLVSAMDKLDPFGVSVSVRAAQREEPLAQNAPGVPATDLLASLLDVDAAATAWKFPPEELAEINASPFPFEEGAEEDGNGHLAALSFAVDAAQDGSAGGDPFAEWLLAMDRAQPSSLVPQIEPNEVSHTAMLSVDETAATLSLPVDVMEQLPVIDLAQDDESPAMMPMERPAGDFDAEAASIAAFERMNNLYSEHTIEGVARFMLSLAGSLINFELGRVFLIRGERFELYEVARIALPGKRANVQTTPIAGGLAWESLRQGVPICTTRQEAEAEFTKSWEEVEGWITANILVVPIQHEYHSLGAIELRNSARDGGFCQGEKDLLSYLAAAAATYIETALAAQLE